jgi:hypothetical protein
MLCKPGSICKSALAAAICLWSTGVALAQSPASDNPVVRRFKGQRLDLWSLKKPTKPALPAIQKKDWPRNSIDHFILARQEGLKLSPSPEADRRTLVRRLSFDLLGLPPTPEEVQKFVNDPAPDAYERLVERLLASSHYGEHWGRHWLDVVRYADTHGFERDEFRPQAWRYRDYVIRSFNEDRPYDVSIREQLAGDELANAADQRRAERLIATGYLRLGPYDSTASLFGEDPKGRDQLMADLVNTTGSAFLGMTLACCQCHDHKYDPLLQADHFRMRAFFAGVRFRDDLVIDSAAVQAEINAHNAALDQQVAALKQQQETILAPVRERLIAERRAAFPDDIKQALAQDEKARDEVTRNKLKPFLEKLSVPSKDALAAVSPQEKNKHEAIARQIAELDAKKRSFTTAMGMTDTGTTAPPTRIFAGGNYNTPAEEVQAGFLSIVDPKPAAVTAPPGIASTGRRTALANWIASKDHPLTARVLVNRIWQYHFGRGIVATPNDFGYSGKPPTHPELLDWLAVEFMEDGWSIKRLQRRIVLSATYRQVSTIDAGKHRLDPENQTFWRQNIQRLEAEGIRDALLAVSGKLLPTSSGPPVWPEIPLEVMLGQPKIFEKGDGRLEGWYTDPAEKTDVRSIFTVQKRSLPLPFLQAFDQPESTISCGQRTVTTVAPQSLMLLNSREGVRLARELANRVTREAGGDASQRMDRAFWLALSRAPDAREKEIALDMLSRHQALHHKARPAEQPGVHEQAALADLCRALINLNEFIYVD